MTQGNKFLPGPKAPTLSPWVGFAPGWRVPPRKDTRQPLWENHWEYTSLKKQSDEVLERAFLSKIGVVVFLDVHVSFLGRDLGSCCLGIVPGPLEPQGKDDMKKEQDRQKKELPRGPVIAFTMVCWNIPHLGRWFSRTKATFSCPTWDAGIRRHCLIQLMLKFWAAVHCRIIKNYLKLSISIRPNTPFLVGGFNPSEKY